MSGYSVPPVLLDHARRLTWLLRKGRDRSGLGFMLLGEGHFSMAFEHEDYPDYVVKVSGRAGFGAGFLGKSGSARYSDHTEPLQDTNGKPAKDAWQVYARWCVHNEGLHPALPRVYHLENISDGYAFALMERLQPKKWDQGIPEYMKLDHYRDEYHMDEDGEWLEDSDDYLYSKLAALRDEYDLQPDMHEGNVMQRGKQLVCTDPFAAANWGGG